MADFEVLFRNTRSEISIEKWYVVEGVDTIIERGTELLPTTVKFTFSGDKLSEMEIKQLFVNARVVRKDGTVSDKKYQVVTGWFTWNENDWPQWLVDLKKQAWADFTADKYELVLAK